MAKDQQFTIPTRPQWETRAKRPLTDGLWPGIDNSLWLWRAVPMASVTDARSADDAVNVGYPLFAAYEELARMAGRGNHRRQAKGTYRQTHALLLNIPALFEPNPGSPIRGYLAREFGAQEVLRRVLLFGVKLRPSVGNGGWRSAIDSVVETLQFGGAPLSDFDKDRDEVSAALSRAGFAIPSANDLHLADSWWNHGRSAGIPVLPHEEHIHYFRTVAAARRSTEADRLDCASWPEQEAEHAVTFAAIEDFDLRYSDAKSAEARWVTPLLDQGARVISVRALVEPANITRNELRSQQRRYRADLQELAAQNKMDREELYEREQEIGSVESVYAKGGPATLTETSVVVGFSGVVDDIEKLAPPGLVLSSMVNRQAAAWHETMVCSAVRANPLLHDVPDTTVAFSALPSISRAGDADGALLGLTERDRQPAYLSPTAASGEDAYPLLSCFAASGAGKTVLMQFIADQYNRMGVPQLLINPKQGGSLSDVVAYTGGTVTSLDEFVSSDGALDPLRIIPDRTDAITKASSMIAAVNPFGPDVARYMTEISYAIDFGAKAGAQATGEALMIAREAGVIDKSVVDPIFRFAEVYPMFRATFGMHPSSAPLSLSNGMTLVEVGNTSFDLPPQGWQGEVGDLQNPTVRTSMNIIRMLIWGGMSALRGRGGVIHFDESWIMEKAAPGDLDQVGRLARSWNVLPILYTQKPSGQKAIGLKGYISRGLIGHIKDETEARAALEMFGLESNTELLKRITTERYLADGSGVNWDSLQALPHPGGGVLRGSVFFHIDLRNRVAPVEVTLNPEFLKLASTTPEDVARRKREREAGLPSR